MKRSISFIFLLILFACANKKPAVVENQTLKVQYHADAMYVLTNEKSSETIVRYTGSDKALQKLKVRGIKNPMISNRKSRTESVLKTGKLIEGSFPVTLEYVKTISNDGRTEVPDGTVVHGRCNADGLPVFDIVESDELEPKYKRSILQSLEKSFGQLSFPEEKLKPGLQFSRESTLSFPMEGATIEMIITTTYKLISITNGLASLDVSQTYAMTPSILDNSFRGTGNGKGKLVYDVANAIVSNYTLNTEMEIDKKLDSFDFNLKTKGSLMQTSKLVTRIN